MKTYTITLTHEEAELLAHAFYVADINPAHRASLAQSFAKDGDTEQAQKYERIATRHAKKLELFTRILTEWNFGPALKELNARQIENRKALGQRINLLKF